MIQNSLSDLFWQHAASILKAVPQSCLHQKFLEIARAEQNSFADLIQAHVLPLGVTHPLGFDLAALFILEPRENRKRTIKDPAKAKLAFINSRTGSFAFISTRLTKDKIKAIISTPDTLNSSLECYSEIHKMYGQPFKKLMGQERGPDQSNGLLFWTAQIQNAIKRTLVRNKSQTLDILKIQHRVNVTLRHDITNISDKSFLDWLNQQTAGPIANIAALLNTDALKACERISYNWITPHYAFNAAEIYNLICHDADRTQAFRRIAALELLVPTGQVFLNKPDLWIAIANRAPLFEAVADAIGRTSANTVRQMLRQPVFHGLTQTKFEQLAVYLDAIPLDRWPKSPPDIRSTERDFVFFEIAMEMAVIYGQAFGRNPVAVLTDWSQDIRKTGTWHALLEERFKNQLNTKKPMPSEDQRNKRNAVKRTPEEIKWLALKDDYRRAISNIQDFKNNVARMLIRPAVIMAMDSMGLERSAQTITNITNLASNQMWSNSLPSEQIGGSNYWHSARVGFTNRLSAVTKTLGMRWTTLFENPIELSNRITAHALGSDEALREEASHMAHCVWSYGPYCIGSDYLGRFLHIFSLRDQTGKRLSTLCISEPRSPTDRFSIVQNLAYKNTSPPSVAASAAEGLVEKLNTKTIELPWDVIHKERDTYKAKKIENDIGYDFRNEIVAAEVIKLYLPCLPRKAARGLKTNWQSLIQALTINNILLASTPQFPGQAAAPTVRRPAP